ncbi:B12-binding domain-containing radical SAM protein [Atlantibacter hermannii]|uniref:B12-binding domain-containing radical SAM protein n=1 Tax=Atlantibacter hermannii TaxID=565 RepID=UPI0028B1CF3B|nr:radical SAM protein [Atlantibacter hermannii]
MDLVFFISAGQLKTKKGKNVSNQRNMYLNYGLLSLATIVNKSGYSSLVFHGNFTPPVEFFDILISNGLLETKYPIYISIPSYYALSWTKEITLLIRQKIKNEIIIGGRWVIDNDEDSLKAALPYADEIITGIGENKILTTITNVADNSDYNHYPLNYALLHDRQHYQPSIEVSRGCGKGCLFCQEKDEPLKQLKSPEQILDEYNNLLLLDDFRTMTPYFEASLFSPTEEWLKKLINARVKHQKFFLWRAECRVDSLPNRIIPLMAEAGMGVIDLGLESACLEQLCKMKKSLRPEKYLERASSMLKLCHKHKIKTKVNVMFYAGENENTIAETRSWLDAHREYIYGISCGVVSAFGWDHNKKKFIDDLCQLGASICHEESFLGVTNFHLSETLTYHQAINEAKKLSKEFMTMERFFYLKAFSYYPRNYTFEQFQKEVSVEQGNYSFRCD